MGHLGELYDSVSMPVNGVCGVMILQRFRICRILEHSDYPESQV